MLREVLMVVQGIYIWYQKGYNPERLEGNILSIFQSFKSAYDSKNLKELSRVISDSYSGSFSSAKSKDDLLQAFKYTFDSLPSLVNINLTINVYQIVEDSGESFKSIVDFKSNLTLLLVPFQSLDSGRLYVEARPDNPYGIWKITSIDIIND
ncbi:MAG TPA: hypothetical protein DCZ55_12845 [Cyanobacteria bacterium UBA11371]|nr:hypothetical protein [Cyanobacteria bacterium UBA11371]